MVQTKTEQVFYQYRFTKEELREVYKVAVADARAEWKLACLQEEVWHLKVVLGYSKQKGLMYSVYWTQPHFREEKIWEDAVKVDIIKDTTSLNPAQILNDYQYRDYEFYGEIEDMKVFLKENPLGVVPFETIALKMAKKLMVF